MAEGYTRSIDAELKIAKSNWLKKINTVQPVKHVKSEWSGKSDDNNYGQSKS